MDNGNGTATLAGTPGSGTDGTYPLTITAANGVTPERHPDLHLDGRAGQAPAITSADSTTFTTGNGGHVHSDNHRGTRARRLAKPGRCPTGVTFVDNGDGTATLAGTPAAGSRRHLRVDDHSGQRRHA